MYSKHLFPLPLSRVKANKWKQLTSAITFSFLISSCQVTEQENQLEGFWTPRKYVQSNGESLPVDGHISFGKDQWSVVFFVLDEEGNPINGSAEGGRYELRNDNLTFWHHYNLSDISKGESAALRKSVYQEDELQKEHCNIEIEDNVLVIYFPSGNAMIFSRNT